MASQHTFEPWRVGVLFSSSGCMAVIEETQLRGTLLAIEEINAAGGVNGREIEPVICDPSSEATAFGICAKRLMIEHGISTIFGCYTSSSRKAVLPVVERLNGLLWYPTLYEGFEFSPNIIYTGAAPNQNSVTLCQYLTDHYGSRFYFVGSDYIYPHLSARIQSHYARAGAGPRRGRGGRDLPEPAIAARRLHAGHPRDPPAPAVCHLLHGRRRVRPFISTRATPMPASIRASCRSRA